MTTPADRVKAMYDGFAKGDFQPFLELMHEQVVWHLPGDHPYAGTTHTRDELVTRLLQQSQETGGTTTLEWVDAVAHGSLVVVIERLQATRTAPDRRLDVSAVIVFRFEGDTVVEAWDVFEDQAAYDAFWSAA